ncbi:hypothetical protein E2P81_ATG01129 [Venturia nashicola]|uniref:Transmembrane protein n=1 Tax=Venturia nashicola TaxID=86259 RepID=A0A4Z1PG62_9PEZI|nr:hypothetical protein E6O75_ATG01157 [Venturia nashicola]TLD38586.1 hypothetical protein E2P81_ATG01129 [Venturia nashicola]
MSNRHDIKISRAEPPSGVPLPLKILFAIFFTATLCAALLVGHRIYSQRQRRGNGDQQRPEDVEARQRAVDDIAREHAEGERARGYEEQMELSHRVTEEANLNRKNAGSGRDQGQVDIGRRSVDEACGVHGEDDIGGERLRFENEFEAGDERKDPFGDEDRTGRDRQQFEVGSESDDDEAYDSNDGQDHGEHRLQFEDEFESDHERKNPFGDGNRVRD